ncbi:MAG: hypothetical protein ACRD3P_14275 [Terriglobales bacterium]
MSTRSSIWLADAAGKCVHIYWELADRDIEQGRPMRRMVAPVYLSIDEGDANKEINVRLLKTIAEEMLRVLSPNWRESYQVI